MVGREHFDALGAVQLQLFSAFQKLKLNRPACATPLNPKVATTAMARLIGFMEQSLLPRGIRKAWPFAATTTGSSGVLFDIWPLRCKQGSDTTAERAA